MLSSPTNKNISNKIPPNYSSWETIELSYQCAKETPSGDVVECGVAACNNFGAMCLSGKFGWGFDSFEGIPWAGPNDDQQPGIGSKTKNEGLSSSGITVHSLENGIANMKLWGFGDDKYLFIKGWFQNTIPEWSKEVEKISVLRLDGDLYDSTIIPLGHLYNKVVKGGILIIDDWGLAGARKAVYDYFTLDNMPEEIFVHSGVKYFRKWA